jgi:hypothetical protein
MRKTWRCVTLDFVPGGCTGIWQPCDVEIQCPFKLAIKRARLEDVVTETMSQPGKHSCDGIVKLDTAIGTLCRRSVAWILAADDVGSFNLLQKSGTGDDADRALFDHVRTDRAF